MSDFMEQSKATGVPPPPYDSGVVYANAYPVQDQMHMQAQAQAQLVAQRNEQLDAISRHIRDEMTYQQLLAYFPMPRDASDELYIRAMGHGIHPRYWPMLNVMKIFDIAFIIDNSGSMGWDIKNNELPRGQRRRYDELKYNSSVMVDICTALDEDGIDIYTINPISTSGQTPSAHRQFGGSRFCNINNQAQLISIFNCTPDGGTPLKAAADAAIADHSITYSNPNVPYKPLLLVVSTDGAPNDRQGFRNTIQGRNKDQVFVTFLICSDQDADTEYLNDFDSVDKTRLDANGRKPVDGVEVIDDYRTEKNQVIRMQGSHFGYSRGDHEARKICGPVFPLLDQIDEIKLPDFDKVGDNYMPPDIANIIVRLAKNNKEARNKMREYAKTHPDIARYMLDVEQKKSGGCVIC